MHSLVLLQKAGWPVKGYSPGLLRAKEGTNRTLSTRQIGSVIALKHAHSDRCPFFHEYV